MTDKPNRETRRARFLREQQQAQRREERAAYHMSLEIGRRWAAQYEAPVVAFPVQEASDARAA